MSSRFQTIEGFSSSSNFCKLVVSSDFRGLHQRISSFSKLSKPFLDHKVFENT
jgi:hypothetical protein